MVKRLFGIQGIAVVAVGFWLLLQSNCAPSVPCVGDFSNKTDDPNQQACSQKCECNNQNYEGFCSDNGLCTSWKRESCDSQGKKQSCQVHEALVQGGCKRGEQVCQPPHLSQKMWGDCQPVSPQSENTPERCKDGVDNDCDGKVDKNDEDCQVFCVVGESKPCYLGPTGTKDVGECKGGFLRCDEKTGRWPTDLQACQGQVLPQQEICNGKDDDCNGKTDEDLLRSCQSKCGKGAEFCAEGKWEGCTAPVPQAEVCDGKDNDCDGSIDEDLTRSCVTLCGQGKETCQQGQWSGCTAPVPQAEVCDGKDNDCDGVVDEGCECTSGQTRPCGSNKGECKQGVQKCVNNRWSSTCEGEVAPTQERCDGKDNDCDGDIDDSLVRPCQTACESGLEFCYQGQWMGCTARKPQPEVCDGVDNDCNGQIDEGLSRPCSNSCGTGSESCQKGIWGQCTAPVAQAEVCDGKDNDCNGLIDDHFAEEGTSCTIPGAKGACSPGKYTACQQGQLVCTSSYVPIAEVCDGIDNNCNGLVDEGTLLCVITIAGDTQAGFKDGPALQAQFSQPEGLVMAQDSSLYIADRDNYKIRKLTSQGTVSTVAGSTSGYQDGAALSAKFALPRGLAGPDEIGTLYVTDAINYRIRAISAQGQVSTVAGTGNMGFQDGPPLQAQFRSLGGMLLVSDTLLYVADQSNHRIRSLALATQVSTLAGSGTVGHFDGTALQAQFNYPFGLAQDSQKNLFVADVGNHCIRKITTIGTVSTVSTVAGSTSGVAGYQDGAAATALFNHPLGVTVGASGVLYVADADNHRIRQIDLATGQVSTLAGTGAKGHRDGPVLQAQFSGPRQLLYQQGSLYIADSENHCIRQILLPR